MLKIVDFFQFSFETPNPAYQYRSPVIASALLCVGTTAQRYCSGSVVTEGYSPLWGAPCLDSICTIFLSKIWAENL